MKKIEYEKEDEWDEEEEPFSPTTWDRLPGETVEDYIDRIEDQEGLIGSWND